jgi:hypothetical protein
VVHLSAGRSGSAAGRVLQQSAQLRAAVANDEKLAVLDFLIVQYAAFERQLDIMRAGEVLPPSEHERRAQKLSQHLDTLLQCRRGVQEGNASRV